MCPERVARIAAESLICEGPAIRRSNVRQGDYLKSHSNNVKPIEVITSDTIVNKALHKELVVNSEQCHV